MNETIIALEAGDALPGLGGALSWGIAFIRLIQGVESPPLTLCMRAVTFLGSEWFCLPAAVFILWCLDARGGTRVALLLVLSVWLNLVLKNLCAQPRPFHIDPSLGLVHQSGFGFPSGHAQNTLVFWGAFLGLPRKRPLPRLLLALGVTLYLLICFSRLYLGVHFPTDILGGWLLGGLLLALAPLAAPLIRRLLERAGLRGGLLASALAAWLMNMAGGEGVLLSGAFFGLAAGGLINLRFLGFAALPPAAGLPRPRPRPRPLVLAARLLLGGAGAAAIYLGLRLLLPGTGSLLAALPGAAPWAPLGTFLRGGALGLWLAAGAPWLFIKVKLASGGAAA